MRIDKLPVVLGGLIGVPIAVWLAPRRVLVPLAVLVLLVFVFVAEGAAGASVIDRYLMGAATVLLIFCAVAIGGWSMLERGSWLRRAWMVAAAALVLFGAVLAATTLSLSSLRTTLAYHEEFHKGLAVALADPAVKAELQALSAGLAAGQQADPGRPLDPRQHRTAQHRRPQRGPRRRRQRRRQRSRTESAPAASRSTRSAARCSSRRSSTSAMTRATRFRSPVSNGSSRVATTRSMATAEPSSSRGTPIT